MSRSLCLLLAALCVILTSCTGVSPFNDDLLRPPRLTEEQREIEEALVGSVNSGDLTFKYPKSGEHRSAFIFQDIDGDGQEEALVFYVTSASGTTFLSVLDRMPDGKWQSPCAVPGVEANVEFVSFANLTDSGRCDILVGWSDATGQQKRLAVYSYLDGALENRLSDGPLSYETYLVENLDSEPLSELVVLYMDTTDRSHYISLYAFDGTAVKYCYESRLSAYMAECRSIRAGRLSLTDSRKGIFIDELLEDSLVTEVFVCEPRAEADDPASSAPGKLLRQVIWESMTVPADMTPQEADALVSDEEEAPVDAPTLYDLTRRPVNTDVCGDVNSDGIIEIPTGRLMPGYDENGDPAEQFYLTQYKRLQDNALVDVYSVAINREAGYQVRFPSEWVDHVTIVNQVENNEWRFIEYNSQLLNNPLEDWSSELMRIRVVLQKDYQDRSLEKYTMLDVRGSFTYYGFIPETAAGPLSITMEELKSDIFSLTERKGVFES